jgi:hypothetical protein
VFSLLVKTQKLLQNTVEGVLPTQSRTKKKEILYDRHCIDEKDSPPQIGAFAADNF